MKSPVTLIAMQALSRKEQPVIKEDIIPPSRVTAEYAVTLVDIGGTNITASLVGLDREGNLLRDAVFARKKADTHKGVSPHYEGIASLVKETQAAAGPQLKIIPIVCAGSPGRYVNGAIQPGSAANLGAHGNKHEFDGVKPAEKLEERLPGFKVFLNNDAVAQMAAALSIIEKTNPGLWEKLKGRTAGYIGPGTGLGGAFAKLGRKGDVNFITDGHIYDMMLPSLHNRNIFYFEGFRAELREAPLVRLPEQRTKAEDLLSGRSVRQIACAIDRTAIENGLKPFFLQIVPGLPKRVEDMEKDEMLALLDHSNDREPMKHMAKWIAMNVIDASTIEANRARTLALEICSIQAATLSGIAQAVYEGSIEKFDESTARWPDKDKKAVKGITQFVIGGSMLTRGAMGELIIDSAQRQLRESVPHARFTFIPMKGVDLAEEAAFGAFSFAPKEEVRRAIKSLQ